MKKVFKFLAAALAIVAAASCAKENSHNNTTQTPDQELVHKVFSASLNVDSDTKTTLHTDGLSVHWTEDDKIRIAPENTDSWSGDLHATAINETFAVFEGEVVETDKYWAVYPAGAVNTTNNFTGWKTDGSTIVISNEKGALATQYAVDNNFSIAGAFNASSNFAVSVSYDADNPTALSFKNINAYIKVNLAMDNASKIELSSDSATSVPTGSSVSMSTASELGGPIVLNFNSSAAMNEFRNGIPRTGIQPSSEIITFSYANGDKLKSGVDYYIAIPAVKIDGFKLEVKDAQGNVIKSIKKNSTFDAKPNTIYKIGTIESNPPVKVGDYFYSDGTYSTTLDKFKTVVGVVIFAGNPKNQFNDSALPDQYCNGLAISVSSRKCAWNSSKLSSVPASVQVTGATTALASFGLGGYTATQAFGSNNYTVFANGTAPTGTSGWYLGAANEWKYILANMDMINSLLEGVGDAINPSTKSEAFWLPYFYSTRAAIVYISGGAPYFHYEQYYYDPTNPNCCYNARPIFAF